MTDLKIRNIDEKVLEALKERAKRHGRSLEAEVRQILVDAVTPTPPTDLLALADQIAAMTPDVPQTDSADLLREDRDR